MIKKIDHVGIAVKSLDEAVKTYRLVLGQGPVSQAEIPGGQIKFANFQVGEAELELIEGAAGSPLAAFIAGHGEGLHHLAFEVEDIEGELQKLAAAGVALIDTAPRPVPGGRIAFVGPEGAHGVTIELRQPDKK